MRRFLLLVVLVLLAPLSAWSQQSEELPRIGSQLDKRTIAVAKKQRQICATSPSQLDPCFERSYAGIRFTIAYHSETKKVTYIFTTDEKFRTKNGLKILDEIAVSEQSISAWPGWQVEAAPTVDGWVPVISDFDMKVKLSNGTMLNLPGQTGGSTSGNALIRAFGKRREPPPTS